MDKNSYEFLPTSAGEDVSDQYLVVQDDGTLLINRQIHYVTTNEESLNDAETSTVDVSSQQFLIDIDNSTITLSGKDQLIHPDGENNIYNAGFLLQPDSSFVRQPIVGAVIDQPEVEAENVKIYADPVDNKQTNIFTEITLTDEQVRLLEQKGWILLETNDKVFVLNTMGLHDITNNGILIQKLRNEIQSFNIAEASLRCATNLQQISSMPVKIVPALSDIKLVNNTSSIQQTVEETKNVSYIAQNGEDQEKQQQMETAVQICSSSVEPIIESSVDNKNSQAKKSVKFENMLRIKTKMSFKDIPNKIFLGKSRNGKNLYAKVKACSKPIIIYEINEGTEANKTVADPDMGRTQFLDLVYKINGKIGDVAQLDDNINAAKPAIAEIFKIPSLRHYIVDQYLFITRITHKIDVMENAHYKSEPYLLTGVLEVFENDQWKFVYTLNILDDILKDLILEDSDLQSSEFSMPITHIHIKEMKSSNNIVRVSVNLAKQQLCFVSVVERLRRPSPLHACGTCAAVFSSERELESHQENPCSNADVPLVIDATSSGSSKSYITYLEKNRETHYCTQCNAKFTRLRACEKHVTTHYFPNIINKKDIESSKSCQQTNAETENKDSNKKVYKCTMCPGTYFHSSSFSKHLVSQHIKLQLNETK